MADIIFSKSSGVADSHYGKLETPLKMVIQHESDLLTKKGGVRDWLFNVEKSNKFGETIVGMNEFDTFQVAAEGDPAEKDTLRETYKKFIEHIQFMKEFAITQEMMEDANFGVPAEAKRRAENFTRAYYKTMHRICEAALAGATATSMTFNGATVDLTTGDGLALFATQHVWGAGDKTGKQSNLYATGKALGESAAGEMEEYLASAANVIRNMKDENGDPLGYTADTIILPGNRPVLEAGTKKACGSEGALGNNYNDINLQYGNWNVIVMPDWQATADQFMVMSSEANRHLGGNMFFNRVPLSVRNWIDNHTWNNHWNGRCRFGVGFGTYKHIALVTVGEQSGASAL